MEDPTIRHPGLRGLKTWLFEGPKSIGSVWVVAIGPYLLGGALLEETLSGVEKHRSFKTGLIQSWGHPCCVETPTFPGFATRPALTLAPTGETLWGDSRSQESLAIGPTR